MSYSVTPISGVNLNSAAPVNITTQGSAIPNVGPLGLEVFGADGKRYVLAQAASAIPASTATCTVSPTTFQATTTGGSYTSPAVALNQYDFAWFGAASV